MTVLHLYDESDVMAGRYVEMLMQATQALKSEDSLFDEPCAMYACTNAKDCQQHLPPSGQLILHLHGASVPFALPAGHRLVVTPHGNQLGPVRAYVVVARSPHEADLLRRHFPRVEVVRNPLITRTLSPEDCARQMKAIYRRVMDSNVLQLMDTETCRLLTAALAVATYGDVRWLPSTFHYSAANANFRLLWLYATNEGVLSLVQRGLSMLGVGIPHLDPADCYLPPHFQPPLPMPEATVADLLADIRAYGPSLLRLSELARALHGDNINEESLLQQLEETGLLTLLASLLPLLADQLLLTEGFMPCSPSNGLAAQQLRQQLAQRQEL